MRFMQSAEYHRLQNIRCSTCDPVLPSGKAIDWSANGPRFGSASALHSLQKLWSTGKLQTSLSSPFLPTLPDAAAPRKGNHPVLRSSIHRNSAISAVFDLSRPVFFSSIGVPNSLSEFCVQHCSKCSLSRWLEISWFTHAARVS